ncbi:MULTISPECIES: RepB family protein [Nostoc]|uniref:Protein CopB n=2 Tax=Nostoc TaxID=1177 RepID=A0ABR8IJG7_9NOSO|nr:MULTISPECIES: RepB family protein [Nostoc]MBD2564714.1 CopG family transcriptional regulator [Nostoc linckia FACHB-391]MBD2651299.1 CopG family transcriptional regulator [Nostoc foliaceum FACHB-393]
MSKKSTHKKIDIDLAQDEVNRLEKYCKEKGKKTNDVIQELIRKLPD